MKRSLLSVLLFAAVLAVSSPLFAACGGHQINFGGHAVWEYLGDNNFAENCSGVWSYDNSGRGTLGICSNLWSVSTYTLFTQAYPASNRTYQVVHIPGSSEPGYLASNNWTAGFSYEMIGTGSWWETLEVIVFDNDTGSIIWRSGQIHGTATNCFNPTYAFTANLSGKNVRYELKGSVATSGFQWKVTGAALQRTLF